MEEWAQVLKPWLMQERERLSEQLLSSYLNKNREDISDLLRGKILQLDDLLKLEDALKNTTTPTEFVEQLSKVKGA